MTEKQFNIFQSNVVEDGEFIQVYEKALNELATKCSQLEKENEQLKQRIKELKKEVDELSYGEADWLIEEML